MRKHEVPGWAGSATPRRLHAVWLLSLLLHAAVIVAWLNRRHPPVNPPAPRMVVRIIRAQAAMPATTNVQPPRSETAGETRGAQSAARAPSRPAPINMPMRSSVAPAVPLDEGPARAPAEPTVAPQIASHPPHTLPNQAPLRLDGSPQSQFGRAASAPGLREQALNDARSNTPRLAPQARLAQSLGSDDRLQEEALGDGRRRFRKGAACVDVHATHIAHLNPFDERLRDIRVAKACD